MLSRAVVPERRAGMGAASESQREHEKANMLLAALTSPGRECGGGDFSCLRPPRSRTRTRFLLAAFAVFLAAGCGSGDQIDVAGNIADDRAVILADFRGSTGCNDDLIFREPKLAKIGNALANSTCNSVVSVFSDDNAVKYQPRITTWTDNHGDIHAVKLEPMIEVSANVWLVRSGALVTAQVDLAIANLLYNRNNAGVKFSPTFRNVAGNTAAELAIGADCSSAATVNGSQWFQPGKLNIYYADSPLKGQNCILDRNIIYIGSIGNAASLSHEVGHAYGLYGGATNGHTNALPCFDSSNIMRNGGSSSRNHFSVGQVFRLNIHNDSKLNLNLNRKGPTEDCPVDTESETCPKLCLDSMPH